jgi:hypothetical protein
VGLGGNINNAGTTMYLRVNVNYDNITIQPIDINHNMLPKIMIV